MAKVIGVSGPQGGGKTTLLAGLKEKGLFVDDFKVAREVQAQLGWTSLERVMDSVDTMMAFQTKIVNVKREREEQNRARTDVDLIFTERTFADIAAYTQLWSFELACSGKWSKEDASQFATEFADDCSYFQNSYAGNMLLPFMPHIAWQADPSRAQHHHIKFITNELDVFFETLNPKTVPVFTVASGSIVDRVEEAHAWVKTL